MPLPLGLTTTISSSWLAATQMLSSPSMISPSAPLMLLTKVVAAPATPPLRTSILVTVSLPVLATKRAVPALLNCRPFAPNGGTPVVASLPSDDHGVAAPPLAPVFQILPVESEMYTLPA